MLLEIRVHPRFWLNIILGNTVGVLPVRLRCARAMRPPYGGKSPYSLHVMSAIPQPCQPIVTALYRDTALYGDTAVLGDH